MKYVDKSKKYFLNTGNRFPREVIWAIGLIKYAAAWANKKLGVLDSKIADIIMDISLEIAQGKYDEHIEVDVYGTGSGTGLNMNINELISMIAEKKYGVHIHPNDHVNLSQSSNDVVPTAIRLATLKLVNDKLLTSMDGLIKILNKFIQRYGDVTKAGRTHLRDALPITFGLEFGGYLEQYRHYKKVIKSISKLLCIIPIGGTAVGTGFGAPPKYDIVVTEKLKELTDFDLKLDRNKTRSMKLLTDFILLSSVIKCIAIDTWKLAQDLRLMYSGPNTGLNEIDLDIDIIGSSMMPGKKNPVTLEAVIQACSRIIGLDSANSYSSLFGEFELALSFPVIIHSITEQINLMAEALDKMASVVMPSLKINIKRAEQYAHNSLALVTALRSKIGYEEAAKVVEEILEGKNLKDVLEKYGISMEDLM